MEAGKLLPALAFYPSKAIGIMITTQGWQHLQTVYDTIVYARFLAKHSRSGSDMVMALNMVLYNLLYKA